MMSSTSSQPPAFDPQKYKDTTREQWQAAAEAWHRWGTTLTAWLGEATAMGTGQQVLDVAAGAGEQTLLAARRVGPKGGVLATDISSNILEFA
jgi:ubiquinone/menaquinone biosynthesis C-methylase UbiE